MVTLMMEQILISLQSLDFIKEVAEGERFELPDPFGSAVFKTAAFSHSAIPPHDKQTQDVSRV